MMFVVGQGQKYDIKPDFESNYALAEAITTRLAAVNAKLVRPIRVKPGRYNQHIGNHCLLIEVGHNANTLEQALAAMPLFAEALVAAMQNDRPTGTPQNPLLPSASPSPGGSPAPSPGTSPAAPAWVPKS